MRHTMQFETHTSMMIFSDVNFIFRCRLVPSRKVKNIISRKLQKLVNHLISLKNKSTLVLKSVVTLRHLDFIIDCTVDEGCREYNFDINCNSTLNSSDHRLGIIF